MSKSSENCSLVTFTEKIFNETLHFCAMENERNTLLIIRVAHHVFLTLKHIRTSQQQVPLKFSKDFYKPLLFILQNLSSYVLMCCELKYSLVDTRCAITLGHNVIFLSYFFQYLFQLSCSFYIYPENIAYVTIVFLRFHGFYEKAFFRLWISNQKHWFYFSLFINKLLLQH